jgi:hypothetical protein
VPVAVDWVNGILQLAWPLDFAVIAGARRIVCVVPLVTVAMSLAVIAHVRHAMVD